MWSQIIWCKSPRYTFKFPICLPRIWRWKICIVTEKYLYAVTKFKWDHGKSNPIDISKWKWTCISFFFLSFGHYSLLVFEELLHDVRLHFDIYNQNGNLFDYETTLRLECIKWQLPLFLCSLMRWTQFIWGLIYVSYSILVLPCANVHIAIFTISFKLLLTFPLLLFDFCLFLSSTPKKQFSHLNCLN